MVDKIKIKKQEIAISELIHLYINSFVNNQTSLHNGCVDMNKQFDYFVNSKAMSSCKGFNCALCIHNYKKSMERKLRKKYLKD